MASSLASDDVYVLETPDNTYVWHGKGASDVEKKVAERIVQLVSPGVVALPLDEGSEPDKFWNALGGKGDYDTTLDPPGKLLLLFVINVFFVYDNKSWTRYSIA